ncbi:hypothetical protein PMAYCL1PPCAC_22399, partial [Pristionchus mayeri]
GSTMNLIAENLFVVTPDAVNGVKEEPMEIKNEPIDEFDEIEQPIADIFCPSTGTSRPIIHSTKMGGMDSSDDAGDKPFPCHYCDQSFRTKGERTRHIRYTHKIQPNACRTCGLDFYGTAGLK